MGNWQLEVFRMALYISFPVGLFHYFNQPENFEEWVTKVKKETFPPISRKRQEEYQKFVEEVNRKYQEEQLKEMEMEYKHIQK